MRPIPRSDGSLPPLYSCDYSTGFGLIRLSHTHTHRYRATHSHAHSHAHLHTLTHIYTRTHSGDSSAKVLRQQRKVAHMNRLSTRSFGVVSVWFGSVDFLSNTGSALSVKAFGAAAVTLGGFSHLEHLLRQQIVLLSSALSLQPGRPVIPSHQLAHHPQCSKYSPYYPP